MGILETVDELMTQGLRNGMSLKQLGQRIPAIAARRLAITEQAFHDQLEGAAGYRDENLERLAIQVVARFTPAEQRAIALRK